MASEIETRCIALAIEEGRKDRELFREEFGKYPVDGPTFGDWDAEAWSMAWDGIKPDGDFEGLDEKCWDAYRVALFADGNARLV